MSRAIVDLINFGLRIPFPRPISTGGGGAPTGKCVYCNSSCAVICVDGVTDAECAALHANCGNFDKGPYVWTQGASCGGPNVADCGGGF